MKDAKWVSWPFRVVLVVMAVGGLYGVMSSMDVAKQYAERGELYLDAGQYELALRSYKRAASQEGFCENMWEFYQQATRLSPWHPLVIYRLCGRVE